MLYEFITSRLSVKTQIIGQVTQREGLLKQKRSVMELNKFQSVFTVENIILKTLIRWDGERAWKALSSLEIISVGYKRI